MRWEAFVRWATTDDQLRALMYFGGLGLLTYGVAMIHVPAAFITAGASLMFIADRGELVRLVGLLRLRVPLNAGDEERNTK